MQSQWQEAVLLSNYNQNHFFENLTSTYGHVLLVLRFELLSSEWIWLCAFPSTKSVLSPWSKGPLPPTSPQLGGRRGSMLLVLVSQEDPGLLISFIKMVACLRKHRAEGWVRNIHPTWVLRSVALTPSPWESDQNSHVHPSSAAQCGSVGEDGPLWPGRQVPWPFDDSFYSREVTTLPVWQPLPVSIAKPVQLLSGVRPVTLPSVPEGPYQCHTLRRMRLWPQHHCFWPA